MPLHSDSGDAVIRRIGRRAGGDGGVDGHNTLPNPREGDFLLVPPLLFIRLPFLRGDELFSRPFSSSRQVALSSTSPTLDEAAPNSVNMSALISQVQWEPRTTLKKFR